MCGRTSRSRRSERGDGDGDGVRDGSVVGIDSERGDTSGARAYERDTGGPRGAVTTCHGGRGESRLKKELPEGETVDEPHGAATAGTGPR